MKRKKPKRKVYFSYLLNKEKDVRHALGLAPTSTHFPIHLCTSVKAAKKQRHGDCYDGGNKPGPIVRVTLEVLK